MTLRILVSAEATSAARAFLARRLAVGMAWENFDPADEHEVADFANKQGLDLACYGDAVPLAFRYAKAGVGRHDAKLRPRPRGGLGGMTYAEALTYCEEIRRPSDAA